MRGRNGARICATGSHHPRSRRTKSSPFPYFLLRLRVRRNYLKCNFRQRRQRKRNVKCRNSPPVSRSRQWQHPRCPIKLVRAPSAQSFGGCCSAGPCKRVVHGSGKTEGAPQLSGACNGAYALGRQASAPDHGRLCLWHGR